MTDQDPTQRYEAPVADQGPAAQPPLPDPALPQAPSVVDAVTTAPLAATTPARPGRSRLRWLVAAVVALLVVGTAAGATLLLTGQSGAPGVLSWVPADSIVYAEVRLDLPGNQKAELAKAMTAFPGFDDQAAFPAKLTEALDILVGKVSSGKMSYRTDIEPWFGGQVSVSMGPLPATADAAAAHGLVIANVKDAAKAGAWATKMLADAGATTATESYNGTTLTTINPPVGASAPNGMKAAWATFGSVIALGDAASVKAAIDTRGTAGLPSVAQFKTALAALPGDRLGFGYADVAALTKGATTLAGAAASAMPSLPAFMDNLAVPWAAGAIRARDGAFVLDSAMPHASTMGAVKNAESKLPSLVPPTTVALVDGHSVGEALQRVKTMLAQEPSLKDGVKQVDDALSLLGGYGAIVDWMGEAGVVITRNGDQVAGGLVVTPLDPKAPAQLFTQLRGFISLAGGSSGLAVTEEAYGGATIVVIDLGKMSQLIGAASGGALNGPDGAGDIKVAYAVTGDVVVIGSGVDFVKSVLDARTGDSLAKSARFQSALKLVDTAHSALIWLDVAGIRTFAESLIPASGKATYESDVKPYLSAFDSIIGASTPGESLDRSTLVIRVSGS